MCSSTKPTAAGIVHFSWFFRYMEEAEHALWREAGSASTRRDGEVGFPACPPRSTFTAPLRFEQEFDVRLRVDGDDEEDDPLHLRAHDGRATKIATGTLVTVVCVRTASRTA